MPAFECLSACSAQDDSRHVSFFCRSTVSMSGRPVIGSLHFAHTAYTLHRQTRSCFQVNKQACTSYLHHVPGKIQFWLAGRTLRPELQACHAMSTTHLFANLLMGAKRVTAYTQPRPTVSYNFRKTSTFVMTLSPGSMP